MLACFLWLWLSSLVASGVGQSFAYTVGLSMNVKFLKSKSCIFLKVDTVKGKNPAVFSTTHVKALPKLVT